MDMFYIIIVSYYILQLTNTQHSQSNYNLCIRRGHDVFLSHGIAVTDLVGYLINTNQESIIAESEGQGPSATLTVRPEYASHFTVTSNGVTLRNAQLKHGGKYRYYYSDIDGTYFNFDVIILDTEPVLTNNLFNNLARENEMVKYTCHVNLKGRWMPTMHWYSNRQGTIPHTDESYNFTEGTKLLRTSIEFPALEFNQGEVFYCKTNFSYNPIIYAPNSAHNVPQYSNIQEAKPLRIMLSYQSVMSKEDYLCQYQWNVTQVLSSTTSTNDTQSSNQTTAVVIAVLVVSLVYITLIVCAIVIWICCKRRKSVNKPKRGKLPSLPHRRDANTVATPSDTDTDNNRNTVLSDVNYESVAYAQNPEGYENVSGKRREPYMKLDATTTGKEAVYKNDYLELQKDDQ